MSQGSEISIWAQVGGFALAALGFINGAIYWILDRMLKDRVNAAVTDMRTHFESEVRIVGDTGLALRQKIVDVELWNRDNFVRRDEFKASIEQINLNVKTIDNKIDRLRDSLDEKLDRLLSRP